MGGIAVAINAWLSDDALQHVLERSGARICIADQERAKRLHPILTDLRRGGIKAILVARSDGVASGMLSFEKAVAKYDQPRYHQLPEAEVAPDDMATIYTTSGTTSMPKLVPATHRMYVSNIANNATSRYRACLRRGEPPPVFNPADPQKSLLLSVPLFHVTANHSFLQTTLIGGGKLVLMPKWNVKEAMRLIKEENITAAGGVPSMAFELVENDDGKSLASLDTLSYGGAAAAESLPEAASGRLPNLMVCVNLLPGNVRWAAADSCTQWDRLRAQYANSVTDIAETDMFRSRNECLRHRGQCGRLRITFGAFASSWKLLSDTVDLYQGPPPPALLPPPSTSSSCTPKNLSRCPKERIIWARSGCEAAAW